MQVIHNKNNNELQTFGINCKFRKLIKQDKVGQNKNFFDVYNADYFCVKTECVRTCRFENCPDCKRD